MLLSGDEWAIVGLSLQVSLVAIIGVLPVAFALAYLLARGRFPGKVVVDALVHLPLVLPPVVIGWMLLIAFAPHGIIGALLARWLGITLMFRWTGAALAAGIMAMPLMVRSIRLSLEAIDPRLEAAARTLGAGRAGCAGAGICPLARRIWCDDHVRFERARRNRDFAAGDLCRPASAGTGNGGMAAGAGFGAAFAWRADRVGNAVAARQGPRSRNDGAFTACPLTLRFRLAGGGAGSKRLSWPEAA